MYCNLMPSICLLNKILTNRLKSTAQAQGGENEIAEKLQYVFTIFLSLTKDAIYFSIFFLLPFHSNKYVKMYRHQFKFETIKRDNTEIGGKIIYTILLQIYMY